jgi:hypothetical protein
MRRPLSLRVCQPTSPKSELYVRDSPSGEDPLPATVELSACGYVLARNTQITASKTETTDDK